MIEPPSRKQALAAAAMDGADAHALTPTVLDALPLGICALDPHGRIVSLNREAVRLLGWSEAACRGQALHDLIACSIRPDRQTCPNHAGLV